MAITKSPKNHEKDSDSKSVSNDDSKNDGDLEERILIPSSEGDSGLFSWRKLWLFTGPGWLMSIAYLDPGNIEADLQSGVVAKYKLLWVLLWSTVLGAVLQRLSARLGVVSGKHLAEVCHDKYPFVPRIILWIMVEIAIIGSDMQEVVGTATAIYLLSSKVIPLWAGTLITIVDTFTFLLLDKYGLRKLELVFALLIAIMAFSFGYTFFYSPPPAGEFFTGMALPSIPSAEAGIYAVGAVGAIIMPHNFYLHSALVKTRLIDRKDKKAVSEGNKYFTIEGTFALFVSFILNLWVVGTFGKNINGVTYQEAYDTCNNSNSMYTEDMVNPNGNQSEIFDAGLNSGGMLLGCTFGIGLTYIWAVGILASGQSSTMTGTYSGQFAMEGFLNLKWKRWQRVLFTRAITMAPTFSMAYFSESPTAFSSINDLLNVLMSIQLPFALIPLLTFTSSRFIMGDFVNGKILKWALSIVNVLMIVICVYGFYSSVTNLLPADSHWLIFACIYLVLVGYLLFIGYLGLYMLINLGFESLTNYKWVQKCYNVQEYLDEKSIPQQESSSKTNGIKF